MFLTSPAAVPFLHPAFHDVHACTSISSGDREIAFVILGAQCYPFIVASGGTLPHAACRSAYTHVQ